LVFKLDYRRTGRCSHIALRAGEFIGNGFHRCLYLFHQRPARA
jgi:hypothetical protein